MGRRSINTTKSGKYMNPTDQARKEARKKELKKNKKQRIAVRHAVLKSKDALQLLEEASMYDKQEYDPSVQASLNERVLQGKRKRLLDTFDSLLSLYKKEDAEYAKDLQRARKEYDKRRHDMMLYYEQVKLAERTKASDIPLPDLPPSHLVLPPGEIALPVGISIPFTKGILKKPFSLTSSTLEAFQVGRKPPGPPPSPVPDLSDSDSEDLDGGGDPSRQRRIRFADSEVKVPGFTSGLSTSQIPLPPVLAGFPRLIRPGYPGSQPPVAMHNLGSGAVLSAPPTFNPFVETAVGDSATSGTTIEAKPQLKNLIGDATRFVPTSLKVRRTVRDPNGRLVQVGGGISNHPRDTKTSAQRIGSIPGGALGVSGMGSSSRIGPSKDAAYEEFMREIEGLL